jgi:hypothetical protein
VLFLQDAAALSWMRKMNTCLLPLQLAVLWQVGQLSLLLLLLLQMPPLLLLRFLQAVHRHALLAALLLMLMSLQLHGGHLLYAV